MSPHSMPALPQDDVTRLVRSTGTFLLRNSSEGTFDLHNVLQGIGAAYDCRVEAMVTMEGLSYVITYPDLHQRTGVLHAQPSLERLDLVSEFKDLEARITSRQLSAGEAVAAMEALETSTPPYTWWMRFVGVVLFAVGFSPSMQANWQEVAMTVVLGAVMAAVYLFGERTKMIRTMLPLLASGAVALVGFGLLHVEHAHGGPVLVMVPALFVMIPGDFLCAAAAEISVGQFTVGTIRLVQSTFVLMQLAGGVLLGAALSGAGVGSLLDSSTVNTLPWIVTCVAWIPFTVGMALTFCARVRDIGWLLLGVYLAWGVQLITTWSFGETAGTFAAATALTLLGVLVGSSPKRPPSLVIILGGVFVLTVGSMALRGITTLAGGHLLASFGDLATFVKVASALSFGLIVGTSIGVAILRSVRPDVVQAMAAER